MFTKKLYLCTKFYNFMTDKGTVGRSGGKRSLAQDKGSWRSDDNNATVTTSPSLHVSFIVSNVSIIILFDLPYIKYYSAWLAE